MAKKLICVSGCVKALEKSFHCTSAYHNFGLKWEIRSPKSLNRFLCQLVMDIFPQDWTTLDLRRAGIIMSCAWCVSYISLDFKISSDSSGKRMEFEFLSPLTGCDVGQHCQVCLKKHHLSPLFIGPILLRAPFPVPLSTHHEALLFPQNV